MIPESVSLTCTCPGFTYRLDCKHTRTVEALAKSGATFSFPFLVQSHRDPRRTYTLEVAGQTRATGNVRA